MRLSRLYSNKPGILGPIDFRGGLNVVLGEIHRPQDRDEDTHNLGKTLLAQLIDFCLLRRKKADFFLFKYAERFAGFVFYLEIELNSGSFTTIRRSVDEGSKASFLRHEDRGRDLTGLTEGEWDHWLVPFETAKNLLDGILNLTAIAPWTYRQAIAFSLRTQRDYDDPFTLAKFGGKHRDWKPLLAHIFGLDSELVQRNYDLLEEVTEIKAALARQRAEVEGLEDRDKLRGLISIREAEVERFERELETYDFKIADSEINRELVDELDARISGLNERRYYLDSGRKRSEAALREGVEFDLDHVESIFRESRVYFEESLRKGYEDLVAFNQAITEERNAYLLSELEELRGELERVDQELTTLNARRSAALVTLRDREVFSKYRRVSQRLVERKTDLESLRRQEAALEELGSTKRRLHERERELERVREAIEINLEEGSERYRAIRITFNEIVSAVIDQNANLYTKLNQEGNPEFHADLLDEQGRTTSGAEGHTYGRLLCIAFDMAVQRAYLGEAFPHFIYHDGVLESLDDRKKLNLIEVIREYGGMGLQHIVTVIDSELPSLLEGRVFEFQEEEVVLRLHDEDESGRLFQMAAW